MIFKDSSKKYVYKHISRKNFDKIKISKSFREHPPRREKLRICEYIFVAHHRLSPIIVNENYTLIDGYCAYLLAKEYEYRGLRLKIYMLKKGEKKDGTC